MERWKFTDFLGSVRRVLTKTTLAGFPLKKKKKKKKKTEKKREEYLNVIKHIDDK